MQVIEQLKKMSPERFLAIYQSLELNGFGPMDGEVAKSLRFRPQAVRKLAMPQRAKRAKQLLESMANTELAYELFGAYLIRNHKGLVTEFLDATGVPHEDGMISDIEKAQPKADKIADSVRELDQKFEPEDVTLYLAMCAEQWSAIPDLDTLWRARVGSTASST
jgi:hypothetical protein